MKIEITQKILKVFMGFAGLYTGFVIRDEGFYSTMKQYDDISAEHEKNLKIIHSKKTKEEKIIKKLIKKP